MVQINKKYNKVTANQVVVTNKFTNTGTFETDTLSEATSGTGVTVDGVLIQDGRVYSDGIAQELTESGAITINSGTVILNHATVAIEATLDAPTVGDRLLILDFAASGTAAHTVTLPAGVTWDGTNNTATFNAVGEYLDVVAVSATRWYIITNNGSVALSSV